MAEALAWPTEIDPAYVRHSSSGVLTGSRLMVTVGHNNEVAAAAEDHGLLAGFVSTRFGGDAGSRDSLAHPRDHAVPGQRERVRRGDRPCRGCRTVTGNDGHRGP
ncbi:MAG: hypothetical protein HOQ36_06835 [Nocardia sp.]|nr:hypothetical protein [Nocardia sp.]